MQFCVVVLTLAVVGLVVVSWRVMMRLEKLSKELSTGVEAFRTSMEDARYTFSKVRTVLHSVEEVTDNVRAVSTRFESVGNHAMDLASAVVDEIGRPVRRALALVQGVRAGTSALARHWSHRNTHINNGGRNDVRHEEHV
jgi:hypothetical protein